MGAPNDEAVSGHRLFARGLDEILWAGEVLESELIKELERQDQGRPDHDASRYAELSHHIILTKECTVEVAARSLTIERHEGSTVHATNAALRR